MTVQRYNDGEFLEGGKPFDNNEAKLLVTSNCDTTQTSVIPNVTWGEDMSWVTINVTIPEEEDAPSVMPFLEPSFYRAFWSYTGLWCSAGNFFPTNGPTTALEPTPIPEIITTQDDTPCLSLEECDQRRQELGFNAFYTGVFPTHGCFFKGENSFFGEGGTVEEMSESDLLGVRERIWCKTAVVPEIPTVVPTPSGTVFSTVVPSSGPSQMSSTEAPSSQSSASSTEAPSDATSDATSGAPSDGAKTPCLSQEECDQKRQELGFSEFHVGEFPSKGCFYKNQKAFYGEGGTTEEMAAEFLPGLQERIWCKGETLGLSENNALSSNLTPQSISYPKTKTSLVEKTQDDNAPNRAFTLRRSFLFNMMVTTFMAYLLISVIFLSGSNGSTTSDYFFGVGKFAVAAFTVSALLDKQSHSYLNNDRNTENGKPFLSTQSRVLQTCTFNVEILVDGCSKSLEVAAPSGRVLDVDIQNFTSEDNKDDKCTSDYTANLTFPVTGDSINLDFSSDATARVDILREGCYEIIEGRPFVDNSGSIIKSSPLIAVDDSWSRDTPMKDCRQVMIEMQSGNDTVSQAQYLLGEEWTRRALGEHSSIASFSVFSIALMTNHAPSTLVEDALHAGLDEVRHARTSFEIASRLLGKEVGPGPLPASMHTFSQNLTALAMAVAREGCVDETLSALAAAAEVKIIREVVQEGADNTKYSGIDRATLTWIGEELQTIANEESSHSALAWRTLNWVCSVDVDACNAVKKHVLEESNLDVVFHRRFDVPFADKQDMLNLLKREWKTIYDSQKLLKSSYGESDVGPMWLGAD